MLAVKCDHTTKRAIGFGVLFVLHRLARTGKMLSKAGS
jgi:hypothetical protein